MHMILILKAMLNQWIFFYIPANLSQQKLSPKSDTLHVWNSTLPCRIFNTCTFFSRRWNIVGYSTCCQCRSKIQHNHGVAYSTVICFKVSLKTCTNCWISDAYRHLKGRPSDGMKCRSHGNIVVVFSRKRRILDAYWHLNGWPSDGLKCWSHGNAVGVFLKASNIRRERCWRFIKKRRLTIH